MRTIGTPSTQARKLNAIASGTLPSGDPVVVNADGTVSIISGEAEGAGTPVAYNSNIGGHTAATFDSNSNKVVLSYQISGPARGEVVVGTVSGTSISFGTPVVFESSSSATYMAMVFDSNSNKVVIAYNTTAQCRAIVGTVSGTSISFGTATAYDTSTGPWTGMAFDSNSNKVVISYSRAANSYYGTAVVGTVSGTSISFGTKVVFQSARSDNSSATFDSLNNKVVIGYQNRGNTFRGTAIVGTVSGTSISFGSSVAFDNTAFNYPRLVFDNNSNKVVIVYASSAAGAAIVGTVSGTSISFGSSATFKSSYIGTHDLTASFDSVSNKVVIAFADPDNSEAGTNIVGTVSGTSISFGNPIVFDSLATEYIASTFDSNSNRTVLNYKHSNVPRQGVSTIFTVGSTNLTDENFIGLASNGYNDTKAATIDVQGAINDRQSGLTAGQSYYVQANGTLNTTPADPSVFAGTAISANKMIVKG